MLASSDADASIHRQSLACGAQLAVETLPARSTAMLYLRVLSGLVDEPVEHAGIHALVEQTINKGTQRRSGRELADAFDARGARFGGMAGRQSAVFTLTCLPEFLDELIPLVAEALSEPAFPQDACKVAVDLAQQELRHLEDSPQQLLRREIQRITLGEVHGRHVGGDAQSLRRLGPADFRAHWQRAYGAQRLQIAVAGPVDSDALAQQLEQQLASLGPDVSPADDRISELPSGARAHLQKDLKQEYIAITLPGCQQTDPRYATEQVFLHVLAGGFSARLFTEVREKRGLVYWVGAWAEHPRGGGVVHVGASTTPERCRETYEVLLAELRRVADDVTEAEVDRARRGLIAHHRTEGDLTRARAASLSEGLFYPLAEIGLEPKIDAIGKVTLDQVRAYAANLPQERANVATVGPVALEA